MARPSLPPSQTRLLFRKGFFAFFVTQLLSALNDNFLKNAVVIWISATRASMFGLSPDVMISLCSGVFILPFFLFSATAGQLADRHEKPKLIRLIKLAEIAIMVVAALGLTRGDLGLLLASVFCLGVHSAFLGPLKYGILPQLVGPDDLVAGNALVEMGTFLAILAGTIGGGVLVLMGEGPSTVAIAALCLAVVGYLSSRRLPVLPPVAPDLDVQWNPITPTIQIIRIAQRTRAVWLSLLGISWFWFFGAAFLTILPGYAQNTLGAHAHVVTLFLSVFCVGIALGSLLTEKVSGKNLELGLVPLGSIGMTLFTFDLFLVGAPRSPDHALGVMEFLSAPHAPRILFDMFAIAIFGGFFTVPLYTLIQQRAEPTERSRVIAANNVMNALLMVAASIMLAVLFAQGISVPQMFLVVACLNAAVAIYIYSLLPEFLIRFIAFMLARVMYRLEVYGHEKVPETGGVVVVCNHVSFVDFMIIAGSIRRPTRFVMDHRIAATPGVSALFKQVKAIPIAPEREDKALMEAAFQRISAELREGEVVCIFPEGRLTKNGEMDGFRAGIDRILKETPVPVVPMALDGLWGSMFSRMPKDEKKRQKRGLRHRLTLTIGEVVPAAEASAATLEAKVRSLLPPGSASTRQVNEAG
jgi:1-acyl-sn-glycerol-3-phosphate acyltransferase